MTRVVDGACIFLNRPDFPGGAGCALHRAALEAGERPLDWKPEVCWQLPLRLDDAHRRERAHAPPRCASGSAATGATGGSEFHWWCTDDPLAFVDREPVYETLRDEIVEMVGEDAYDLLAATSRDASRRIADAP